MTSKSPLCTCVPHPYGGVEVDCPVHGMPEVVEELRSLARRRLRAAVIEAQRAGISQADIEYAVRPITPGTVATPPAPCGDGEAACPCDSTTVPGRVGHDVPTVQRWMTLDLYNAVTGDLGPRYDFDEWYDRKGFGDAWSALCVKVQEVFRACPGH